MRFPDATNSQLEVFHREFFPLSASIPRQNPAMLSHTDCIRGARPTPRTSRSSERPLSRAVLLLQSSAGVAQLIDRLL